MYVLVVPTLFTGEFYNLWQKAQHSRSVCSDVRRLVVLVEVSLSRTSEKCPTWRRAIHMHRFCNTYACICKKDKICTTCMYIQQWVPTLMAATREASDYKRSTSTTANPKGMQVLYACLSLLTLRPPVRARSHAVLLTLSCLRRAAGMLCTMYLHAYCTT